MPKGQYDLSKRARGPRLSLRDRFYSKVAPPDERGCRLWTGAVFASGLGYGQFQLGGKPQLAHRVAWLIEHGVWPDQDLMHSCDTPLCVEIEHLSEGSQLDNSRDMIAKGRNSRNGKLTDEQCRGIRQQAATGPRGTIRRLAREYGVSETMISMIRHRQRRTQ